MKWPVQLKAAQKDKVSELIGNKKNGAENIQWAKMYQKCIKKKTACRIAHK